MESALLRQLAGGHAAAPVQDAEAAEVGAVQPELERDGLVQPVTRAAQFVELDADLVDEAGGVCLIFVLTTSRQDGNTLARPADGARRRRGWFAAVMSTSTNDSTI